MVQPPGLSIDATRRARSAAVVSPPPVILCPLRYERDRLARAGLGFVVVCCGPGAAGARRGLSSLPDDGAPVIIAGTAGSLVDPIRAGSAHVVTEVVDAERGERWRTPLAGNGPPCVITSSAQVVGSPDARRALHESTGAALVDMEAVEFARALGATSRPWAIVRGVSDDPSRPLPPGAADWTSAAGNLRVGPLLRDLLRRPALLSALLDLRRVANEAMDGVAELVAGLGDGLSAREPDPPS